MVHSELAPTGEFDCSEPLLNQLQHNIIWGQKGNFVDVPTDCPQRDERLGGTGDAQVFAPTACFNMQAATFYSKWLKDMAADQGEDGRIPNVVPDILHDGGATGWADARYAPWAWEYLRHHVSGGPVLHRIERPSCVFSVFPVNIWPLPESAPRSGHPKPE